MICIKDLWFSSRPSAKVGHHGPPGSAREQPWIPRPHLRPGQDFNKRLEEICTRAEQDLLSLMIEQQEKTLAQTLNSDHQKSKMNASHHDSWSSKTWASRTKDPVPREQINFQSSLPADVLWVRLSRIQRTSAGRLLSEPTNPNSQSERSRMQTTKTLN